MLDPLLPWLLPAERPIGRMGFAPTGDRRLAVILFCWHISPAAEFFGNLKTICGHLKNFAPTAASNFWYVARARKAGLNRAHDVGVDILLNDARSTTIIFSLHDI